MLYDPMPKLDVENEITPTTKVKSFHDLEHLTQLFKI